MFYIRLLRRGFIHNTPITVFIIIFIVDLTSKFVLKYNQRFDCPSCANTLLRLSRRAVLVPCASSHKRRKTTFRTSVPVQLSLSLSHSSVAQPLRRFRAPRLPNEIYFIRHTVFIVQNNIYIHIQQARYIEPYSGHQDGGAASDNHTGHYIAVHKHRSTALYAVSRERRERTVKGIKRPGPRVDIWRPDKDLTPADVCLEEIRRISRTGYITERRRRRRPASDGRSVRGIFSRQPNGREARRHPRYIPVVHAKPSGSTPNDKFSFCCVCVRFNRMRFLGNSSLRRRRDRDFRASSPPTVRTRYLQKLIDVFRCRLLSANVFLFSITDPLARLTKRPPRVATCDVLDAARRIT